MRARALARPFPTVGLDTDVLDAARALAERRLPGLIVLDDNGQAYTVLPGSQVLRFVVPRYVQDAFAVMVMLVLITAVASALLDNVTTVLLIAPVTLLVCDRLAVPPVPFLIAEAMASNIGGTATLIGDPPNIIIASRSGLSFNDFLANLTPIIVVLMAVFLLLCRFLFASALRHDPERAADIMSLDEREMIRDRSLLWKCGGVLALVMAAFVAHSWLEAEPSVISLLGAGALVAGSVLLWGSAALSGIVDNIP